MSWAVVNGIIKVASGLREHGGAMGVTTRRLDAVGRYRIPQVCETDILEAHLAVLAPVDENIGRLHI
jgi:hypothetical protein